MRHAIANLIRLYQLTISPDHGWNRQKYPHGFCRFHPTCSEYTRQAVLRRGPMGGLWLGFRRLIRCHPWSAGGLDPVPPNA